MNEPKYEEDLVNLGYLKRVINNETSMMIIISNVVGLLIEVLFISLLYYH